MADRWTRVLDALRRRFPGEAETGAVADFLASQGYNRRQIGEILSLRTAQDAVPPPPVPEADAPRWPDRLRVQGPHERGRFSADAWGYLLMVHAAGVVPPVAFEHLVERALLQVDGRIELTDLRLLAEAVGLDASPTGGVRPPFH